MKTTAIKVLAILSLILGLILSVMMYSYKNERNERIRQENNATALLSTVRLYQAKDSTYQSEISVLTLKKRELEKYRSYLVNKLEEMNIKVKNLESVTTLQAKTISSFSVKTRDSIIYRDKIQYVDTVKCFDWSDGYTSVSGCVGKVADISVDTKETIYIAKNRVPYKFLFFRWGVKDMVVTAKAENPKTKVIMQESIDIVK